MLVNKAKNFKIFEKSFEKYEYNDFSFTISDDLKFKVADTLPKIQQVDDLKYLKWLSDAMINLNFSDFEKENLIVKNDGNVNPNELLLLFESGIISELTSPTNCRDYSIKFKFDVKFNSKSKKFELENSYPPVVRLCQNNTGFYYSIRASTDFQDLKILKTRSKTNAEKLVKSLIETKKKISEINTNVIKDLNPVFEKVSENWIHGLKTNTDLETIHSKYENVFLAQDLIFDDYLIWLEKINNIIYRWVNKNVSEKLAKIIEIDYFSYKEKWIQPCFEWLGEDWNYQIVPC